MRTHFRFIAILALTLTAASASWGAGTSSAKANSRERLLMDRGWRFAFGHPYDTEKDFKHGTAYFSYLTKTGNGDGPASKDFDDRSWRVLDLPHDWAVEAPFDAKGSHSHGYKAIGRNFPDRSVGWYRKNFTVPSSDFGRKISLTFDGVHRDALVFINGFYLGRETDGYIGFSYDVSDYLNYGGENVVSVRVDVTLEEGWFYEGAGIYRDVWLEKTSPLHIERGGIFVSSKVEEDQAEITIDSTLVNGGKTGQTFQLDYQVFDDKGIKAAGTQLDSADAVPGSPAGSSTTLKIPQPKLWSLGSPVLYKLVTKVLSDHQVIDQVETSFGIRSLRFDPDQGFFLNGKHVMIKGTCLHQDHAGVGTAIPDALQAYRVKRLKEMGSNAIRCAHNPPTPELLEVCDRLGMLVLPENRLMGTSPELLDRLKRLILRDRNHPCVFAWSLGNEEWDIEGNEKGEWITATMQAFAKRLDPTRLMTVASSGGWGHGVSVPIELMGYNYFVQGNMDEYHQKYPTRPSLGTEETGTHGTRGIYVEDKEMCHMAPTDHDPKIGNTEKSWKYYLQRPYLSGIFYWTGFDYRGEPNPYGYPAVSSQYGILDLCGFPKDCFYYLKSWWGTKPELHIQPHWNWKGREGEAIDVSIQSNCEEVELQLNGKSLGKKTMEANSHLEWSVPYEPGDLKALGFKGGKEILARQVETSGPPAAVEMAGDRKELKADGRDVSVILVLVKDSKNRFVPTADNEIEFSLEGPGQIIGVGNGDPSSHEPDRFFETVTAVKIGNLKVLEVPSLENRPETAFDFNDRDWPEAFAKKTKWEDGKITNSVVKKVIRGEFRLEPFTARTQITFFAKSIGQEQAVYVNGHPLAKGVKRDAPGQAYLLDHSILREGKNVYAMVGTPLVMRNQWEELNSDPGLVQVIQPRAEWKRKVFNGLAQVIVQTTGKSGDLTLKASSKGLAPARLSLTSTAVPLPPSVP